MLSKKIILKKYQIIFGDAEKSGAESKKKEVIISTVVTDELISCDSSVIASRLILL